MPAEIIAEIAPITLLMGIKEIVLINLVHKNLPLLEDQISKRKVKNKEILLHRYATIRKMIAPKTLAHQG